jgi:CheY-like chemotaxis protein
MPTRVLVVDDEAEVRNAVRRGLELLGYSIETASDGVEGVSKAESWRPDVVLLDLAMPRMGGLRAHHRRRAVVACLRTDTPLAVPALQRAGRRQGRMAAPAMNRAYCQCAHPNAFAPGAHQGQDVQTDLDPLGE